MKIAYFSPLNPVKSGISDFSEELIPELRKVMDIEIFTMKGETQNKNIQKRYKLYDIRKYENEQIRSQFDLAVFHIGNSYACHNEIVETFKKYGGIIELHDASLHHYLAEETIVKNDYDKYVEIMHYCHGKKGKETAIRFLNGEIGAPWETSSARFTVCKHLIDRAQGVIVHSDFAKQMVLGIRPDAKVVNIPLHTPDICMNYEVLKKNARKKLEISDDIYVFGAFGHATVHKRIPQILQALSQYKKEKRNFHFYIVGQATGLELESMVKELDLENEVTVTGYTSLEDFKLYMQACDVAFNLRYPTQGESSASLHRLLGMGKPVLVTNVGSFREYSDLIVDKVGYGKGEIQEILKVLFDLTKSKELYNEKCKRIVQYAKNNYSLIGNSRKYQVFFEQIIEQTYENEYLDVVVKRIIKWGIFDSYLEYLGRNSRWLEENEII